MIGYLLEKSRCALLRRAADTMELTAPFWMAVMVVAMKMMVVVYLVAGGQSSSESVIRFGSTCLMLVLQIRFVRLVCFSFSPFLSALWLPLVFVSFLFFLFFCSKSTNGCCSHFSVIIRLRFGSKRERFSGSFQGFFAVLSTDIDCSFIDRRRLSLTDLTPCKVFSYFYCFCTLEWALSTKWNFTGQPNWSLLLLLLPDHLFVFSWRCPCYFSLFESSSALFLEAICHS